HLLFRDGVADLHRPAADLLRLGGQFHRGEGRPVDAVAPRAAADRHDQVAGPRLLAAAVRRDQPHRAAVDQRVAQVTVVEADRPVDRGDADALAVAPPPPPSAPCAGAAPAAAAPPGGCPGGRSRTRPCCSPAWPPAPPPAGRGCPRPGGCWPRRTARWPRGGCASRP